MQSLACGLFGDGAAHTTVTSHLSSSATETEEAHANLSRSQTLQTDPLIPIGVSGGRLRACVNEGVLENGLKLLGCADTRRGWRAQWLTSPSPL